MGQVQDAERDPRRRAVGSHVAQPDRDERRRPVDREVERRPPVRRGSRARSRERRAVPRQRAAVVLALVARGTRGPRPPVPYGHHSPPARPVIRGEAHDRVAGPRACRRARGRLDRRREPVAAKRPAAATRSAATARPARRPTAPARSSIERPGRQRLAHPGAEHRFVHRPVVRRPSASGRTSARPRPGSRSRVPARRGADMRAPTARSTARRGTVEPGEQPRDRVRVPVEPATDGQDRDLDRASSPRTPIRAARTRHAAGGGATTRRARRRRPSALPHLAPAVADERPDRAAGPGAPGTSRPSRACR